MPSVPVGIPGCLGGVRGGHGCGGSFMEGIHVVVPGQSLDFGSCELLLEILWSSEATDQSAITEVPDGGVVV